ARVALPHEGQQNFGANTRAIDQAYQRLEDGDDFADVARDMSMASSAPEGGFIGDSFRRGELPKAIEEAVFKLKDGEHTEPLLGRSGYNIFKANASRFTIDETTQRKLDALRERLFEQEMNNGLTVMIEGLRKRAYIDMMLSR
ncbi:MAG: peptidylprolyl isomerase, partial [Myxococcota bacterium]